MSINLLYSGNNYIESDNNSFSFDVGASGLTAVISISYLPINYQVINSVTINSANAINADMAQQDASIATSVWYLTNLNSGTNNVDVIFDGSTKSLVNYLVYDGVSQDYPIYKTRSGIGKNVQAIPVKSFCKTSGLAIGFGSVSNEVSHTQQLFGNQFVVFNVVCSGNGIGSEAVAAYGLFDRDEITVPNSLNIPSDWAIVIVGLEAQ
jgi:hypothetical protein